MAVMQLVEQKQLSLSDPLQRFVDTGSREVNQLTLRQLMCHSTGLVDFTAGALDDVEYEKSPSVTALLNTFIRRPLRFSPGANAEYSASNYVLLSLVIEKASGMRLGDYFRENLFVPYGLRNTYYLADSFYVPNFAKSYSAEENIIQPFVLPLEYRLLMGAGAVASNLSDYVRWHSMMMKGYMVTESSLAFLTSPCVLNNGKVTQLAPAMRDVGWYPNEKVYFFGGELNGYMANTMYFPEYQLSIGIGANMPDNVKFIFDQLVNYLISPQ
jgi:CubicO group peptidase (beta-lactamase class C family)